MSIYPESEKRRESGVEREELFDEIKAENFAELMKDINQTI